MNSIITSQTRVNNSVSVPHLNIFTRWNIRLFLFAIAKTNHGRDLPSMLTGTIIAVITEPAAKHEHYYEGLFIFFFSEFLFHVKSVATLSTQPNPFNHRTLASRHRLFNALKRSASRLFLLRPSIHSFGSIEKKSFVCYLLFAICR